MLSNGRKKTKDLPRHGHAYKVVTEKLIMGIDTSIKGNRHRNIRDIPNAFKHFTHTLIDSFNDIDYREELLTSTSKHNSHPELLRQLAFEVINDKPDQALIIYTYGSRSDTE
ncbi:hypothetical protein TNIN_79251 [Trichonephila inaurata madagascariensis]|uniref:Uncharacterized protein n=1 Tax=Trichonephila inaurata madagascariensis TaxID=2747483 RepID=A0A8X6MCZ8_9ARAC|nr:hypothetical protein TNIN_79251 [Trichonephila inaurata madagascariensis]